MTGNNLLNGNPLFKLALPLMVGIAFGWSFDIGLHYAVALLAMAFVLLLWGMHFSSPRSLFAVSAMAVIIPLVSLC